MPYITLKDGDMQDYVEDGNGKRILNAHSRGGILPGWKRIGRQFSPLIAQLKCGKNLEFLYHQPKVDKEGKFCKTQVGGNDFAFDHFKFATGEFPASIKHEHLYMLYCLWFEENPAMDAVVRSYDGARDFFDTFGGVFYYFGHVPMELEQPEKMRACQGLALAWYVQNKPVDERLLPAMERYRAKYR